MTVNSQELRDEITQSRAGQVRWRCPLALRKKVVEFAEQGKRSGVPVLQMAEQLGLSCSGLRRWLGAGPGRVRPVRIQRDSLETASLVLVTPSGYRLEGLDVSSAVDVLGRLSC